jgi:hypothetical protein
MTDLSRSIELALSELRDAHVQDNKHRMGALGAGNIDLAESLLAAALANGDDPWQPIETAPLDGTRVLTCIFMGGTACDFSINHYNDPDRVARGYGIGSKGWWASSANRQPTHWQALRGPKA